MVRLKYRVGSISRSMRQLPTEGEDHVVTLAAVASSNNHRGDTQPVALIEEGKFIKLEMLKMKGNNPFDLGKEYYIEFIKAY